MWSLLDECLTKNESSLTRERNFDSSNPIDPQRIEATYQTLKIFIKSIWNLAVYTTASEKSIKPVQNHWTPPEAN